ncbi:uncharacterized protein Z520_05607 [Fonsecaea multimorphosa CBS 102226]|uniref:Transcription factor domain-containing protein n=1 Tax=Fonsecaea multimorphosa CBS 102226 TaxID=1442371 RepID=A0A0D2IMN5_9EURO|nr:uncharacterized protein Z520_05607 [Fonsecaea multimorphosa CBS 102226]KIX98306.1 hypothetical protein Z520_05607 [Fonsecaea multimorphosa CBS 102226]OAL24501.1 hypothetical protein AYO22_05290 [Fonsecaea multimorphosa]
MSQQQPEERVFTFVDYDINRRGVTETARAHLMKDRVRSKREARSEWVSRNQFSPLRWMRPKEENGQPNPDTTNAPSARAGESDRATKNRISHYAAVIDFQRDSVTVSPFLRKPRSESPRSRTAVKAEPRTKLEGQDKTSSERATVDRKRRAPSPGEGDPPGDSRLGNSPFPFTDTESPRSSASVYDVERHSPQLCTKSRRESMESRSEFGLSLLEGLKIENTPPEQQSTLQDRFPGSEEEPHRTVLRELQQSVDVSRIVLTPIDRNLIRYFALNAASMLGLDVYPEIVQKHDPVLKLFIPFALSSQWCFETMVLLFSANHFRKYGPQPEIDLFDAENHYLAARQNFILAQTRQRISALANQKDSSDEDVVAFLFLALAEYCAGHRQIGLMHFKAWKEYCEMRRVLGIRPCGLPCKTIVWWCISVLTESDVLLDSIINPATRSRVREDPGKLFRYFESFSGQQSSETDKLALPAKLDRRITC